MDLEIKYGGVAWEREANGVSVTPQMARNEKMLVAFLATSTPCRFRVGGLDAEFHIDSNDYGVPFYRLYLDGQLVFQFNENSSGDYVLTNVAPPAGLAELEKLNTVIAAMDQAIRDGSATPLGYGRI